MNRIKTLPSDVMLLLVIFAFALRLTDGGSNSSDEDYRNEVTADSERIQNSERLSSSESALCHICGLCFRNLAVHISIHNYQKPFSCSQCDKQFTHAANLRRHQRIHSGEKLCNCPECGKQFTAASMLRRHQQTHSSAKSFLCAECGKQFGYAQSLRAHQQTHNNENPSICFDCGKKFTSARCLRIHQRTHTGEKPFRYTDCGKQFTRSDNLIQHQRLHTGVKFFNCSHCGMHPSNMHRHLRQHTGEKPHECLECGKRFGRDDKLRDHQRMRHAALKNSTHSPYFGYAEKNFTAEESTSIFFPNITEISAACPTLMQLEELIASEYPSLIQTAINSGVDIPSFTQIRNFTGMKNPHFLDTSLEIPLDGTSFVDMGDSTVMENLFLEKVLENPVDSSLLTQVDKTTELESPFLLHAVNPIDDLSLPENPIENSFLVHMQNRLTFEDPFLFQNSVDNPSFAETDNDTVTEKLVGSPSLIPADTYSFPETPIDGPLLVHVESKVPGIQFPSRDSDSVPGGSYLECPVCSAQFAERAALEEHMLNCSCLLIPLNWIPYVGEDGRDDIAM